MKRTFIFIIVALIGGFILFTSCQQTAVTSAKLYLQQANYDAAIEQCKLAIEEMPNNAEAYFVLGQAYGKKKMYREMNEAFKNSLEFSQKHTPEIEQHRLKYWIDLFNSGVASIKQDQLNDAVEKFNLAIEIIPDRVDAYKNLAFAYTQKKDDPSAIQTYIKAIEIDSTDLEIKNYLGNLYYQNKEYEKAIKVLNEVTAKADPHSKEFSEALHSIAISYDLMGQSDKAIEAYENALKVAPEDVDLMFNMGRLYFMQENYEKAIESFQKVLEKDPDDFDSNLNIGNVYINIADSLAKEAKATDDKGKLILSETEIAQKESLSKGNFEKAIPYLEKATQIKSDNANAWTLLGIVYVRAGMAEKGKEAFDKADELKVTE